MGKRCSFFIHIIVRGPLQYGLLENCVPLSSRRLGAARAGKLNGDSIQDILEQYVQENWNTVIEAFQQSGCYSQ